ncbi:hypothetical protein CA850_12010 [Micromonospora echinospora]|uniref:Uncharacterized protein n=1 Tax=Micromonospora echinospora TaxID=1877 RepID=A0A1C4UD22_MICEC|nr:hypothetical protein [Micromonospora echinospora]OZV80884.1 hypothetical protein CA850_12010 [Micromonospora echinospora]SCE69547.1 hypothetical protein GA0070618_0219 [Micromonospora echinospora]
MTTDGAGQARRSGDGWGLATPPLFAALHGAERVLIAGAGGGFDVCAGIEQFRDGTSTRLSRVFPH